MESLLLEAITHVKNISKKKPTVKDYWLILIVYGQTAGINP